MADKLPEPIFTPATKATSGHDENITEAQTREILGDALYDELKTPLDHHLQRCSPTTPPNVA